jgi:fructosamine-3-kinase
VTTKLEEDVATALGLPGCTLATLGSGQLGPTRLVRDSASDSCWFLKLFERGEPSAASLERDGLAWLGATLDGELVSVPKVFACRDRSSREVGFLLMEWIPPAIDAPRSDADERLGRGLAEAHRAHPAPLGLAATNQLAGVEQDNRPTGSWAEFYWTRRLEPMLRRTKARLEPATVRRFDTLASHMIEVVGPPEPSVGLHGDLWSGNRLIARGGRNVLVDPAVYAGHREIDLAMMRLFGGFGDRCFAAYHEVHPLEAGWERRVALYQLYPLLVHVALFGGSYAGEVDAALTRALGPRRPG